MLGLFTFFYASLHFLSFVGFDHSFDLTDIALDVVKRPFVTVGFAAFCLLVPLAATSNQLAIRRLGGNAGRRCIARYTSSASWRPSTTSGWLRRRPSSTPPSTA